MLPSLVKAATKSISSLTNNMDDSAHNVSNVAGVISTLTGTVSNSPDVIGILAHIVVMYIHNVSSIPIPSGACSITSSHLLKEAAMVLTISAPRQQAQQYCSQRQEGC